MAIVYGANYGRPTLDLNFAKNKSLIDTVTGRNLVTFSRAQANYLTTYVGADGLIKYAGADEPRYDHNPVTGECLGLLIEESRSNVTRYSEQAEQQFNQFGSLSLNSLTAPNGTNTADKLITVNGSGFGLNNYGASWTAGISHTFSIYAKKGEWNRLGIRAYDGTNYWIRITFDLSTGQAIGTPTGTLNIQKLPNDWYRVAITGTPITSATYASLISVECHNTALVQDNETGTGTEGIYLWGAQLEVGNFPTSYIPTAGSTVTRSADTATISGTNFTSWYNNNAGTTFFDAVVRTDTLGFVSHGFLSQEITGHYRCGHYSGNWYAWTTGGGIGDVGNGGPVINGRNKGAFAYDKNVPILTNSFNGRSTNSFTGRVPVSPTSVPLVYVPGSVQVSRLTYYPSRLQDFQLQQLTR